MHDLVIRGGTVVDCTGAPAREADVAIAAGRIAAVGAVTGRGREEVEARGRAVLPGFVDVHTHYDGQATWDPELAPSCWHGVTTVVLGNLGTLRNFWRFARRRGNSQTIPAAHAEGVSRVKRGRGADVVYSPDELKKLLEAAPVGKWRTFFTMAMLGLRHGELLALHGPTSVRTSRRSGCSDR